MAMPRKSVLQEFKDFIWSGNLIEIAIGLILALKIAQVINSFLQGIVNPILAAILGQPNFDNIGFDLGDARVRVGLFLTAIFDLVLTGIVLFLIVKLYNHYRARPEKAGVPTEADLLTEIRDLLRSRQP